LECGCGRFVEIGNDVYMQFVQLGGGKYKELENKNVDTGFGLERNLMYLNGLKDVYLTDVFYPVISYLEKQSGSTYGKNPELTRAMRIVADHIKTSTMLIGDQNGIVPSNVGAGYILRRLLRRAIREAKILSLSTQNLLEVSKIYINEIYNGAYPLLKQKEEYILSEIKKESEKFEKTLVDGTKELNKLIDNLIKFAPDNKKISGEKAFRLFDTFGFPLELTTEIAKEKGFVVDEEGFKKAFEIHQQKSHSDKAGVNKGGLAEQNEQTTRLHTATHLLHNALSVVLNSECKQMGSNINSERLRFDFGFDRKLTADELKAVEDYVNKAIQEHIDVVKNESTVEEAKKSGAIGVFDSKYGDVVSVYSIAGYGAEICGGPHVKNTSELHHFKIVKEEASSSGVRRIKAVLD
ncbi:MAG: alanine--tRNA ligase-related protein, partial [Christensenellales bacterium]